MSAWSKKSKIWGLLGCSLVVLAGCAGADPSDGGGQHDSNVTQHATSDDPNGIRVNDETPGGIRVNGIRVNGSGGDSWEGVQPNSWEKVPPVQPNSWEKAPPVQPNSWEKVPPVQPNSWEKVPPVQPNSWEKVPPVQPNSWEGVKPDGWEPNSWEGVGENGNRDSMPAGEATPAGGGGGSSDWGIRVNAPPGATSDDGRGIVVNY